MFISRLNFMALFFVLVSGFVFMPGFAFAQDFFESFDSSSFIYAAIYGPASGSESWVDKTWVNDNLNGDKALSVNWSAANDVAHSYSILYNKTIYSMSFYVMPKEEKLTRLRIGQNHGGNMDIIDIVFNSFGTDGIQLVSGSDINTKIFYVPRISRTTQTPINLNFDYSFSGSTCNITMSAEINGTVYESTGIAKDATPTQLFFNFYSGVGDASLVIDDLLISTEPKALTGNIPADPPAYDPPYPSYRRNWTPDQIHLLSWGDLYPGSLEPAPYGFAREQNITCMGTILYNRVWMGGDPSWDTATNLSYQVLDNPSDEFNKLIIVCWGAGVNNLSGYLNRNYDNSQYVEFVQYWANRSLNDSKIKGLIFDDFTGTDLVYLKNIYDAKTATNPDFKIYYQAYFNGPVDYSFVERYPKTGYYDGFVIYPRWSPAKVFYTYEMLKRTYLDTGKKPILGLYVSGVFASMTKEYGRSAEEIGIAARQGIIAESEQIADGVTFYGFAGNQLEETGKNVMAQISLYKNLPVIRAPEAPLNLQALAVNKQVNLSWERPLSENGSAISGYRIYRGISSGSETFLDQVGTFISYSDTKIPHNGTFFYQVSAVNGAGESQLSSEAVVKAIASSNIDKPYVFPIPYTFNKNSKLTFSNLEKPSKIEIYSLEGNLLWSKEVDAAAYSFVPDQFTSGVYMYVIKNSKGKTDGKFIIIR